MAPLGVKATYTRTLVRQGIDSVLTLTLPPARGRPAVASFVLRLVGYAGTLDAADFVFAV